MPRPGIQQDAVFTAADQLLADGLRPTVEKVRQHLGTGSPNTIAPMLEEWYRTLAGRLRDRPAANDVEGLPPAALNAFRLLWKTALKEADSEADQRVQAEREALRQSQAQIQQQREQLAREALALTSREGAVQESLRLAEAQISDLRRQVDELAGRVQTETARSADLDAQLRGTQEALAQARRQLDEQSQQHAAERAREAERAGANERRHLQEIDLARTETRRVQGELQQAVVASNALAQQAEGERLAAAAREKEFSTALAERERALLQVRGELLESQAALERAQDAAGAAQELADSHAARAKELSQAAAVLRRTEEDLRGQVQQLLAASAKGASRKQHKPL